MRRFFIAIIIAVFTIFLPATALAESCCICLQQSADLDQQGFNYNWDEGQVFLDIKDNEGNKCSRDQADKLAFGGLTPYICAIKAHARCVPPTTEVTTLVEEFNFKNVVLGVTIPNLHFSPPPAQVDDEGNIYLPWIGEYIKALYNFSVVVISILAVVMLIISGAQIITSAGGPAKGAAYKRITQAVIGLFIAWGSYVILYTINPNLTVFKSLQVRFIEGIEMEFVASSELSEESSSQTTAEAATQTAEQLWATLATIKGENMIGAVCGEKGTCGRADPVIADIFKRAAASIKSKGCVVIYGAGARKPAAQLDKVKKRCTWSEPDKSYVNCGVALGKWGSTKPAPLSAESKICRYADPETPLPPCDMNALLHYKAIDAWAVKIDDSNRCKETSTGSKNCSCSGEGCIKDICQRELIRAMNSMGACVLLGKAKSPDDRTFEPWHFEIAEAKKDSYCFRDADAVLNSIGGTGY